MTVFWVTHARNSLNKMSFWKLFTMSLTFTVFLPYIWKKYSMTRRTFAVLYFAYASSRVKTGFPFRRLTALWKSINSPFSWSFVLMDAGFTRLTNWVACCEHSGQGKFVAIRNANLINSVLVFSNSTAFASLIWYDSVWNRYQTHGPHTDFVVIS